MKNNFDDLSKSEMLNIIGGFNDKAVLRTITGTALLVGSIAAGQPLGVIAACIEIGYNINKIRD